MGKGWVVQDLGLFTLGVTDPGADGLGLRLVGRQAEQGAGLGAGYAAFAGFVPGGGALELVMSWALSESLVLGKASR